MAETVTQAATCATCPYAHTQGQRGLQCREGSPSAEPVTGTAAWPWVKPTDFCGDHPGFTFDPPPSANETPRLL